jgi:cyclic pyranopterin phosphate synthase
VKVLGGEPLLHRRLADVIWAARSTGISDYFYLTTNGVLLHRMDDAVMEAIDELEISLYPGVEKPEDIVALAKEKSLRYGKKLTVNEYDQFRLTFATRGTTDPELVRKTYRACKMANVWGCHTVRDGYFYKCPQSMYIPTMVNAIPGVEADRIRLEDADDLQARLLAFVNSPDPLKCCTYCVGTSGKLESHAMVPRDQWKMDTDRSLSEVIDSRWLERSLAEDDPTDDCKILTDAESVTRRKPAGAVRRFIGWALPADDVRDQRRRGRRDN